MTFNFNGKQFNTETLTRPQKQSFLGLFKYKYSVGDAELIKLYQSTDNPEKIKQYEDILISIGKLIKELE